MTTQGSSESGSNGAEDEVDRTFRILANATRRRLLRRLSRGDDGAVTIRELASALVADGIGEPTREEVEIALVHIHLPILSDSGIVEVDRERETVRYRDGHRLESMLDAIPKGAGA